MESFWNEAAKQAPALAVLAFLSIGFLKFHSDRMTEVLKDKDAQIKLLQDTLASANSTLGQVVVLLSLFGKDLRDGRKTPRN